uniref:Neurofascin n=1 Tax=Oryzias sinensis TaxID=183150 RepID=A0A8C8A588_9TELE
MMRLVGPGLLLLLWHSAWSLDIPLDVRQPPTIIKQSLKDHIVDPKETMVIECEAIGNPHPTFSWRRDGKYFNVARDSQVSMRRRSGTLEIYARNNPEKYEAVYQCIAGAQIVKQVRPPVWPREPLEPVVISAGLPLVLPCESPAGPPKPETYWMSSCKYPDPRVSMGINGDLYFSNVLFNDSVVDYCCNARFPHKNAIQQKTPVVVKVLSTRSIAEAAPTWLSPKGSSSSKLVLQGEELLLECIAAGVPTPHIAWTKDGDELAVTPRMKIKNFNKMIQIPKAAFEDAGEYTCSATNKIGYIEHTMSVIVKAAPFWVEKPTNLILAPEETGRLVCRSDGVPRPTISWFMNGDPIEDAMQQSNRLVAGDTITLRSVTAENTAVYQCNASNQYGYLLANAFVNVLHSTPRIIGPRNEVVKVIEGSRTFLDCRFFGSPVPDLSKYGQGNLEGTRFKTHSNGTLEVKRIQLQDEGTYVCVISNIAGRDENQVRVEVKEPIVIVTKPQSMKVIRGSDVRLECAVKADATTPFTTSWIKNKKQVTFGWRVSLDESNLVITDVNRGDEGNYTCVFKNELDQKSASAHLLVMVGYLVTATIAQLQVKVVNYTLQSETKFRVIAINSGRSLSAAQLLSPSKIISGVSFTAPDVIPKNVKGVGTWRNNMEISWEPLTYREWNGPHLKYLVWWRRRDSREEWKNATTKWLRYYIYDADTFTPYEIKVQAVNDFGLGPESPVVIGYSGEDRPLAAPLNLRISDIESTQVTVHWDPVSRENIMGELKEYKVYYWRDSSQLRWLWVNRGMKSKIFPNNDPEPSGVITDLIPYSNYKMYIVVANSRFEGPPSNNIHFSTPEGVPSAPTSFRIQQRHLDSIYVDWELPAEPNGIITGYSLKYHTCRRKLCLEFPPNVTSFSIRRYDRYTRYWFSVAARTRIGIGEWHTEESPHYTTETYAQDQVDITTQGWFIGIMCAVALIVLILLIVCFIKRSRGGKYPGKKE